MISHFSNIIYSTFVNFVFMHEFTAPTGTPEMFEAVFGQRQVNFSWSPPPVTQHSLVITSYTLSCSPSPSSLPQSPSQSGTLTVAGFSSDTSYTCSLVASNSQGSGPAANISFTTLEDCKIINLKHHLRIVFCLPFRFLFSASFNWSSQYMQ